MKEPEYKVRPSSRADPKDAFRIFLSPTQLLLHKFHAGDICDIVTLHQSSIRPAVVWPATEKIKDDVVQTSKALQILYGLKLDSRICIRRGDVTITFANEVILREIRPNISQNESKPPLPYLDKDERFYWAWVLKHHLCKAEFLTPGQTLESVKANDEERSFEIKSINSSIGTVIWRARPSCTVYFEDDEPGKADSFEGGKSLLVIPSAGVGGLDKVIEQLNGRVFAYGEGHERNTKIPRVLQKRSYESGILLHGTSGTGKSMVLGNICKAGWRGVFHIENTVGSHLLENTIPQTISDALGCQPSVIIIDKLESIIGTNMDLERRSRNIDILSRQLDRLRGTRTIAVGATRSLTEIDPDLRRAGRLDFAIEIPIPDSKSRGEILKVLLELPKDKAHSTLDRLAVRTHGFVGADLDKLIIETCMITEVPARASESGIGDFDSPTELQALLEGMEDAFNSAFQTMRPTIMHGVSLEIPEIKWSDIGGQHDVKKRLERAVVWPLKYPDKVKQFRLEAKKGILLYGPPGCSKTMIARATATEAGQNFIAVKGAELLSKYVGDTERAVREVFARARAARPTIIFFDEIDAVGAGRDKSQQGGIHTVTTLLNELDGIEELNGVFVLAATNKPEVLDTALIRAGRLSETLYVGLPGLEARRDILQRRMQTTVPLSDDVDLKALSKMTEGFTGAEIVRICAEASDEACEEQMDSENEGRISQKHLNTALATVERSVTPEMVRQFKAWGATRH